MGGWYRHLAESAIPPMQTLPRELWRWRVDLEGVPTSPPGTRLPRASSGGATEPRRLAAFQRVGEALHLAGWPALVAASAARPSGLVLCVFRPGTH